MKKHYFLFLFLLILTCAAKAQNLIAVQNAGTSRFYSLIEDAITNAQNKDTIYIPGGAYSFTNSLITIDKELHIIGTGHHPDSTKVKITHINAGINLLNGATNSSFEGFYLNGDFRNEDGDVDNITIAKCNLGNLVLNRLSAFWLIHENIIRGNLKGGTNETLSFRENAQNNLFSNNIIIQNVLYFGPNNAFNNNFFNYSSGVPKFSKINGSSFKNNIIFHPGGESDLFSVYSENNIYNIGLSGNGCIGHNDLFNLSPDIFIYVTGSQNYDYKYDYHLKPDSPGKNAGTDGTDIGIYGGAFPWKAGSIPSNPHYQTVQISPKTDNSGKLNVKIKVAAQDN